MDALKLSLASVESDSNEYLLLDIILRQFQTGLFISEYSEALVSRGSERFSEVMNAGGPADYHTQVMKGVNMDVQYSAGSTTVASGYLLAGLPGAMVSMVLCTLLALLIDARRLGAFTATHAGITFTVYTYTLFLNEDFIAFVLLWRTYVPMLIGTGLMLWWYSRVGARRHRAFVPQYASIKVSEPS
jgi:hypothetical protein